MTKCHAKHTAYQPSDVEWKCPNCGASDEDFYIDIPDPEASDDCELLHDDDIICCARCDNSWNGSEIADIFAEKAGAKPVEQENNENKDTLKNDLARQRLICFLYLLMRDELACGKVARIVRIVNDIVDTEFIYTNQHLAKYAEELLDRLINQKR